LDAKQIRKSFLDFFAAKGHQVVRSSSLIPYDDPTLLFTNAGMNQFKAVLMGLEKRAYVRAASVQKCMRVSGKHNDLEEVGRDARHHTFFEMLGNWSFGDYYKREAIAWGWEFLTQVMKLPREQLWVTVYKDDDESYDIWNREVGLSPARIRRLGDLARGDEENFWAMADTGPCGPCTEIHFDQGQGMACDHPDGCALGVCECDRWLELWNLVFMEFDRTADGALQPLPLKSVDTGLGFERLVAVMQGVRSNYESDLFTPLIDRMAAISGQPARGEQRISMQVIADHARAVTFTVADGVVPSNEGRGYVVRRILRRAARHGRLLELTEPFLWRVAEAVIETMGEAYPELNEQRDRVLRTIRREEERFDRTLDAGLQIYAEVRARMQEQGRTVVAGEEIFKLHDTYGFPVDLTAVVAADDGFTLDEDGFSRCMERQRAASGSERIFMAGVGGWQPLRDDLSAADLRSRFVGCETLSVATRPLAIREGGGLPDGRPASHLLCERTPFYAESGGQIGDTGVIRLLPAGTEWPVITTVAAEEGPACVVAGRVEELREPLRRSKSVRLEVDRALREPTMRHHTATHLLHAALRRVLGPHVEQAGSEVTPDKLRFDFRHDAPLTPAELEKTETLVNAMILANRPVISHLDVPMAEAKARGATALFGEKYGETVRMIEIPAAADRPEAAAAPDAQEGRAQSEIPEGDHPFSLELCGGTHCERTGDIGMFRILSESSSAAGIRRIEAVAGERALDLASREREQLADLASLLRPDRGPFADQVRDLLNERDALRKELQQVRRGRAASALDERIDAAVRVGDITVVTGCVEAEDRDALMRLGDHVRDKLQRGVVALAAEWEGKATLMVTLTPDLVAKKRLHAGDLVKSIAAKVGGRGGGKPNTAQAGLPDPARIEPALAAVPEIVRRSDKGGAGEVG
jgi:alanyl-tRNA synthetase